MKLDRITLRQIRMPLVHFFETSFSRTYSRDIILVEVSGDGVTGWGEVTAGENPFYNEEWTASAWGILHDYVAPRVLGQDARIPPRTSFPLTAHIRGHNMARGGLEAAVWDLEARMHGVPLWQQIGAGARREIPCGVSIGIQDSVEQLFEKIEVRAGGRISADQDEDQARLGRGRGAPCARTLSRDQADGGRQFRIYAGRYRSSAQAGRILPDDDRAAAGSRRHHRSRRRCRRNCETPICLDECIRTAHHAEQAIQLRACGIINIKLGRVAGFGQAKRVHDIAQAAGIPVWCGGMLEAGIGRAHNIALASLPNFVLPGDVSASKRYWKQDIIQPAVETTPHGTIALRDEPGFGYELDLDFIRSITVREEVTGRQARRPVLPAMNPFLSLLRRNHNYRNTWIGQVVSEIGDHFNNVAVFGLVLAQTHNGMVVTGVMLARAIPAILAGPLAGVLLDRFDRKRMMIASDLLRAVVALGFILTVNRTETWLIYLLSGLLMAASPFFTSGRAAILPPSPPRKNCTPPIR